MNAGPSSTRHSLAAAAERPKIMLVDDSEIVRELVRDALEENGYRVVVIDGPFGFGQAVGRECPDLVLMDVTMPALAGDKLVEIARRNPLHTCPIVLFSDRPDAELRELARRCGADGYIRKSPDLKAVVRSIRIMLLR